MRAQRVYKKSKKTTVQLTSLLDLLFVMIFVSLIQQKTTSQVKPTPKKTPKVVKSEPVKSPELKTYFVNAIFSFYATSSNPNTPSGSYNMQGTFDDKTGKVHLGGVNWNSRPPGYDMVPLNGIFDKSSSTFKGKIEFPGCKVFTLKRTAVITNTPVSGTWKGEYDCSQGLTGLTLTIK